MKAENVIRVCTALWWAFSAALVATLAAFLYACFHEAPYQHLVGYAVGMWAYLTACNSLQRHIARTRTGLAADQAIRSALHSMMRENEGPKGKKDTH